MKWLFDPRIFNFILIVLQCAAFVRWSAAYNLWAALYWFAAVLITIAVTYGIK